MRLSPVVVLSAAARPPHWGAYHFSCSRPPWLVADAPVHLRHHRRRGLRLGNRWDYDVAYVYRVLPRRGLGIASIKVVMELNGEQDRQARLKGVGLPDTGESPLFFSPEIEFVASNRLVVKFSSPVPVGRELNGLQMKPTSSFILGFRWLF